MARSLWCSLTKGKSPKLPACAELLLLLSVEAEEVFYQIVCSAKQSSDGLYHELEASASRRMQNLMV